MRKNLLVVFVTAVVCVAAPVRSWQSAPAAPAARVVPAQPATLDPAALEKKVDELLK